LLVSRIQARSIPDQKPKMWIIGRRLRRALRILKRMPLIAALQGLFCGSTKSRVFDI